MSTYVMGDIHGCYKGLLQCLERSGFNKKTDTLIQLGDVVDGWSQVYECVEELLTIPNLITIVGNHDMWFTTYLETGLHPVKWEQGGKGTALSYLRQIDKEHLLYHKDDGYITALNPFDIPHAHQLFFERQILYYIDDKPNCFVHAGFDRHKEFKGQDPFIYSWDRDLWMCALSYKQMQRYKFKMKTPFETVFIGHTATINWKTDQPMQAANIWNIDTGAGFTGRLTIMDVETKEYWQSDPVKQLYQDETGRR